LREESRSSLSSTNLTWFGLGSKPGLIRNRPWTNRPSTARTQYLIVIGKHDHIIHRAVCMLVIFNVSYGPVFFANADAYLPTTQTRNKLQQERKKRGKPTCVVPKLPTTEGRLIGQAGVVRVDLCSIWFMM
jgi:hypothetical protein